MEKKPTADVPPISATTPLAPEDFYLEGTNLVFTAAYHLKRGSCCGSGCRHCPYGIEKPIAEGGERGPQVSS